MNRKVIWLGICFVALAVSAVAQTNVTTTNGGTAGAVPVFTTGSNVENSPIAVSGSNVGIGTTSPTNTLQVNGTAQANNYLVTGAPAGSFVMGDGSGYNSNLDYGSTWPLFLTNTGEPVSSNSPLVGYLINNTDPRAGDPPVECYGAEDTALANTNGLFGGMCVSSTFGGNYLIQSQPTTRATIGYNFYDANWNSLLWIDGYDGSIYSAHGNSFDTGNGGVSFLGIAPSSGGPNCLQIDTSGNVSNTGTPCSSGGESGSISLTTSGTSGAATLSGTALNIPEYQGALNLTTTGTSGAATLAGNTLNIPQYSAGGAPGSPANSYQFNNGGAFGSVSQWLYDPSTGVACNQLALTACDGLAASLPNAYIDTELIYNTDTYSPTLVSDNASGNGSLPQLNFAGLDGTYASPAAVTSGDLLGVLMFAGYDGSLFDFSGGIAAFVDQGVTSGYTPSYLQETNFTGHQMLETWDYPSETFNGIDLEITNAASAANSSAIYVHNDSTNTDLFSVDPNGDGGVAGTFTATGFSAWSGGSTTSCWNTAGSTSSCGGGSGGSSISLTTSGTSGAATLSGTALNIPEYQGALILTTTGTSGAATLVGNTLNIPQYSGGGGGAYTFSAGLTNSGGTVTNNFALGVAGGQTVFGGTQATDKLVLQATTGNGTATSPAIQMNVGDNGATTAMTVQNSGNVGIGTTSPGALLEVNGNVKLTSGSGASITFADGSVQSTAYTGVICGGDFAESVDVTGKRASYEPGDVLVIDPSAPGKFLKSTEQYSTAVLGIYSTKPGTVGRRQTTPRSPDEVPMAMVGIVPTKVSAENGSIKPGDLLVTASTPGYAMKGTDRSRMLGAVIGKALGSLDRGTGVIEVGVTLQ